MKRRAFGRALAALAATAAALPSGVARAAHLTPAERDALDRGESVHRPVDADLEQGTYIGGVAYCVAEAPAPFVLAMLADVTVYKRVLSFTLEANPAGEKGADRLVYFKHGGRLGTAGYTMRLRPADPEGVIRFWMDPAFEHEIEDIWGFVRVEPLAAERCLVTYAVLCDLGTVIRLLFGERVRAHALRTPMRVRRLAGERHAAAQAVPVP